MMLMAFAVAAAAAAGSGLLSSTQVNVIAAEQTGSAVTAVSHEPTLPEVSTSAVASASAPQPTGERWGVDRVNAAAAIQSAGVLEPVLVAVIDTGIDQSHASLKGKVVAQIDFSGSSSTLDENGHGTHMAGTIAAIAPNALFLNVKSANSRGRCQTETVATAIRWAADNGAQVINVSLEVSASTELENAVRHAWQQGAVVIAAAGNSGTTANAYPAAYSEVIAVAATNRQNGLAVLSNHGSWVDIAAPGQKILGEFPGGVLDYETGTSPAAAHVSGIAALLVSLANDESGDKLVNDEVRQALEASATPLSAQGTGSGLVDALAAVQSL